MLPMIKMTQYYDTNPGNHKIGTNLSEDYMLPMIKMTQYYDTRFLVIKLFEDYMLPMIKNH